MERERSKNINVVYTVYDQVLTTSPDGTSEDAQHESRTQGRHAQHNRRCHFSPRYVKARQTLVYLLAREASADQPLVRLLDAL